MNLYTRGKKIRIDLLAKRSTRDNALIEGSGHPVVKKSAQGCLKVVSGSGECKAFKKSYYRDDNSFFGTSSW
ncbi:hypothetical protein TNIN_447061 [Trichonephila inaurata madagascariensis]|uniref:Uncharacterized protein n=1 Tax=Trichonephila inaurata madagascariensis TaxID=2747483 RepID=A0A8X6YJP2_9ARAC|nr:hypothetical protein TNIN_447061 [Trichonephila inaurata madagascariensis]